jgi:hypothetical protein
MSCIKADLQAEKQRLSAMLISVINTYPRKADVAAALSVTPGYISSLYKDPAKLCSLETLAIYLSVLGKNVSITVSVTDKE